MPVSAWSGQQDPLYLSMLARTQFDMISLDMQHGMQTESSIIRGIAALMPFGKPIMVRVPVGRFDLVSKFLDAGAHGIIAPMINSVEDARQFVSYGKYIPTGDRSFGASQAATLMGMSPVDYVKAGNENTLLIAMIETQQAVDAMDDILDVDGIDGVFCGPADLSISVRQNLVPDPYGEDTIDIVKSMVSAARERGKYAGAWCASPEVVARMNDLGFHFTTLGFDQTYVSQGANAMLSSLEYRK